MTSVLYECKYCHIAFTAGEGARYCPFCGISQTWIIETDEEFNERIRGKENVEKMKREAE